MVSTCGPYREPCRHCVPCNMDHVTYSGTYMCALNTITPKTPGPEATIAQSMYRYQHQHPRRTLTSHWHGSICIITRTLPLNVNIDRPHPGPHHDTRACICYEWTIYRRNTNHMPQTTNYKPQTTSRRRYRYPHQHVSSLEYLDPQSRVSRKI